MAEVSALNPVQHVNGSESCANDDEHSIKKEVEIKRELVECFVCAVRSAECVDLTAARTAAGTLLADFLCKFTPCDLTAAASRPVCRACHDLISSLEQAELDYIKHKEAFEAIISKNPLFDFHSQSVMPVKFEANEQLLQESRDDSEDEPLAVTKKKRHRKVEKRKTKAVTTSKHKPRGKKDRIESNAITGKAAAITSIPWRQPSESLLPSPLPIDTELVKKKVEIQVKMEDSMDGSETSQLDNGFDSMFKLELELQDSDDDDDKTFVPELTTNGRQSLGERKRRNVGTKPKKKKEAKTIHQCDQCDAKYTSFKRLEIHKEKHSEGKPPYICEVCGAHYKHKRACDIHVALHKGISDWKCEECNKLFPSKGALQRHNNIHTGKLNYQCDLCGKSFIHTSSFKMHKLSHSGVKPHSCDVCGLALMTRSHLKRHKRVHSGEKRHECNICGKRFSERYNLIAHGKAHESAGEALPPPPPRRLFRCTFCQERFERRYMLERHVSAAHGRTLERLPATPRNTMSKLLKAQAAARAQGAPPAPTPAPLTPNTPHSDITDTKEERSPDSRASSIIAHKAQLAASMATIATGSWSGAYAAEFGIRTDFPPH